MKKPAFGGAPILLQLALLGALLYTNHRLDRLLDLTEQTKAAAESAEAFAVAAKEAAEEAKSSAEDAEQSCPQ